MPKTASIKLGGSDYTVHAFNIEQLERVTELFQGPAFKVPFGVLRIAFERSEPKIDVNSLEPDMEEVRDAMRDILVLSGLRDKVDPPVAGTDKPAIPAS